MRILVALAQPMKPVMPLDPLAPWTGAKAWRRATVERRLVEESEVLVGQQPEAKPVAKPEASQARGQQPCRACCAMASVGDW